MPNTVYLMDCAEGIEKLDDNSVQLIFIDPPYNIGKAEWDTIPNYIEWLGGILVQCERVLKPSGSIYICHNDLEQVAELMVWIKQHTAFKFRMPIIWNKRFRYSSATKKKSSNFGYYTGYIVKEGKRNYEKMVEYLLYYTFDNGWKIRREREKRGLTQKDLAKKVLSRTGGVTGWVSNVEKGLSYPNEEQMKIIEEMLGLKEEDIIPKFRNQKKYHSVWDIDHAEREEHETPKPKELIKTILLHGSDKGDLILIPFSGCYDHQTEILTKGGWKKFKDLTMLDEVASLTQDHEMYYVNPSAIQKYHYKGTMIETTHRSVQLLVTPDHNMYLRPQSKNEYIFMKANDITHEITKTLNSINWNAEDVEWFYLPMIPKNRGNQIVKKRIKMDDFLEFLGWYIAEGHLNHINGRSYNIRITQTKDGKQEIGNCLDRMGYKWTYQSDRVFVSNSKQLYEYLKPLGRSYEKYIPDEFMHLSKRQLKILFNSLVKGDGYRTTDHRIGYCTTSKKLAGQVQEIALKLGYNSTLRSRFRSNRHFIEGKGYIASKRSVYEINIRRSGECKLTKSKHFEERDYDGMVYCCTVPTHIICVRRNGRPVWCGNSGNAEWVCRSMKRDFVSFEIDPKYVKIAREKLKQRPIGMYFR